MPWLAHIMSVDDELYRSRVLADQVSILGRCDALVLVGGWISPHMIIEREHALDIGLPLIDLTDLGERPPENAGNHWEELLLQRATSNVVIRHFY